jgi:hypothetical protein
LLKEIPRDRDRNRDCDRDCGTPSNRSDSERDRRAVTVTVIGCCQPGIKLLTVTGHGHGVFILVLVVWRPRRSRNRNFLFLMLLEEDDLKLPKLPRNDDEKRSVENRTRPCMTLHTKRTKNQYCDQNLERCSGREAQPCSTVKGHGHGIVL